MSLKEKFKAWWTNFRVEFREQKELERRHSMEKETLYAMQEERRRHIFETA